MIIVSLVQHFKQLSVAFCFNIDVAEQHHEDSQQHAVSVQKMTILTFKIVFLVVRCTFSGFRYYCMFVQKKNPPRMHFFGCLELQRVYKETGKNTSEQ